MRLLSCVWPGLAPKARGSSWVQTVPNKSTICRPLRLAQQMQLRFKLRHKGSTQKLHLSSLPTWSTITERIGRAFSLAPEDVGLAYKGKDNTEKLMTNREELDEYIQNNNIQNTGKTMEFDVRDSRAWSSQAGSDVGGARISDDYDDMPDVSPRSPHGFTYVTQLP